MFPSTNFSHSPTHSRGLQYLLLISPDHFFFLFSFPKFQRLLNLQTSMAHRCSLQSLFSSFSSSSSSSSSSFVFSLPHGLCFMPSSRSFFFFFFHLLYRRSNGSDFSFNRKKKTQSPYPPNL